MKCVNLETAKRLRELGYNVKCMDYYLNGEFNGPNEDGSYPGFNIWEDFNGMGNDKLFSAPRVDDAIYWLRDEYDMLVSSHPVENSKKNDKAYSYYISVYDTERGWHDLMITWGFFTYEDALINGLEDAFDQIEIYEISRLGDRKDTPAAGV